MTVGGLCGPQPMAESSLPSPCSDPGISPWPQADPAWLVAHEEAAAKANAEGAKPAAGEVRLPLVEVVSRAGVGAHQS